MNKTSGAYGFAGVVAHRVRLSMGAPKARRRLGSVLEFLDSTDPNGLHPRLARWCRGGPLYWLFDNLEYTLSLEGSFLKPSATNLGGM